MGCATVIAQPILFIALISPDIVASHRSWALAESPNGRSDRASGTGVATAAQKPGGTGTARIAHSTTPSRIVAALSSPSVGVTLKLDRPTPIPRPVAFTYASLLTHTRVNISARRSAATAARNRCS